MRFAAILLATNATALADGDGLTGFVTYGNGELRGRVTAAGKPVAGTTVHVACKGIPEQALTTDARGKFRGDLACGAGAQAFVFVRAAVRVEGLVTTEVDNIIESHEAIPPEAMPHAITPADRVLAYSDAAIDADRWTRAWLLLDVDETGAVVREKLLDAPGLDLDAVAIAGGFDVKFEPARDATGNPMRAAVLWTFEWPAYWFQRKAGGNMYHLPDLAAVGCGRAPRNGYARDCTQPDLGHLADRPWIDR